MAPPRPRAPVGAGARYDNDVMVGLMPLHITRYRWDAAAPGALPRRAAVRLPGDPRRARARGARCATRSWLIWRPMRANGICAILRTSARGPRSPRVRCRAGSVRCCVHHRVCPFIPLTPSWDEFVKRLSKNMRTNVGRRRRQVAKQFRAEYDLATDETLPAAMEELFRLHNARWRRRGVAGAFAGERMQAFHHEVARRVPAARLAAAASAAPRRGDARGLLLLPARPARLLLPERLRPGVRQVLHRQRA